MLVSSKIFMYNHCCGETFPQKEVLTVLTTFLVTVAAGVVVHIICKWLDGRK